MKTFKMVFQPLYIIQSLHLIGTNFVIFAVVGNPGGAGSAKAKQQNLGIPGGNAGGAWPGNSPGSRMMGFGDSPLGNPSPRTAMMGMNICYVVTVFHISVYQSEY